MENRGNDSPIYLMKLSILQRKPEPMSAMAWGRCFVIAGPRWLGGRENHSHQSLTTGRKIMILQYFQPKCSHGRTELYLLFGYSRAIISKLIMIWWTKNFTDGTQTTALPWVCFLGSREIHHLPVIWIILETFKGIRIMRKKIKTRPRVANMLS